MSFPESALSPCVESSLTLIHRVFVGADLNLYLFSPSLLQMLILSGRSSDTQSHLALRGQLSKHKAHPHQPV